MSVPKPARSAIIATAASIVGLSAAGSRLAAQGPMWGVEALSSTRTRDAVTGSPGERTLLTLALLSGSPILTTIRPLSMEELDSTSAVAGRAGADLPSYQARRLRVLSSWGTVWVSTTRAVAAPDGPVWQGRGMTAAMGGGIRATYGPLSITARPLVWATQNRPFLATSSTAMDTNNFKNPLLGVDIDAPYRFGKREIIRLHPGESSARVAMGPLSTGFTTESQTWGPGMYLPLMMGAESGGYPRVFLEARSVNVFIGKVSSQWSMGRLESSGFDGLSPGDRSRIVPSLVGVFSPAAFPGLELGGTRLFHVRWRGRDVDHITAMLPFQGFLKVRNPFGETDRNYNQIAGVFFRVAPSTGGVAVYGEFARDDHNWDLRDLVGEPDHHSAYMLGMQRAMRRGSDGLMLAVLEIANGRRTHIARVRGEPPMYTNNSIPEGHTNAGQMLGSTGVAAGGGLTFGLHRIGAMRTSTFEFDIRATGQNMEGGSWSGRPTGRYALRYRRALRSGSTSVAYGFQAERGYGLENVGNLGMHVSVTR